MIGYLFVFGGFCIVAFGFFSGEQIMLVFGCILMVLGVLLKYRSEIELGEKEIRDAKKEIGGMMEKLEGIEENKPAKTWRMTDLEYRLKSTDGKKFR
ncbi:MAG: hypothetical protein MSIBF_03085 [Candidatus Altiarchaeales archaeon IMC4]|nr:MAG: hypothetical protein MSIBF_03085 [Candidatus Altiarchaeales archaeon IMC4]